MSEYIETIRSGLVCDRCGRYVGSLAAETYLPPAYPVAVAADADDEARSLVTFEWHMLGLLRQGKFTIRHPQLDGRCASAEEWAEARAEDANYEPDEQEPDG